MFATRDLRRNDFSIFAAVLLSTLAVARLGGQTAPADANPKEPPVFSLQSQSQKSGKGSVQINIRQKGIGNAIIAVRPAEWASAVADWKKYRTSQGHEVIELDSSSNREELQKAVRKIVEERSRLPLARRVGYLVLMADAPQTETKIAHVQPKPPRRVDVVQGPPHTIPTFYRQSTALVKYGGDKELATDVPYADLDGDEIPELAIGRIPADSAVALQGFLARTLAYEQLNDFGTWRRDLRVVAGVGGFGALADGVIEMTTRRFLTDRVPSWADVCMTYASPNSPYCPDPLKFSEATIDQLNAGSMFWVYVGHGHVRNLDYVRVEQDWLCILHDSQVHQVNVQRPPIAVFLACYTGAYDAQEDSIAEQLVLSPNGPPAALAATRVTGPYGLAALASEILDECFDERTETLGGMMLNARRRMFTPDRPFDESAATPIDPKEAQMQMITAIATALSPEGHDLRQERIEHVWQLNLLGDPLLRVARPDEIVIDSLDAASADSEVLVNGKSPRGGKLTLQLARRRDSTPADLFTAGQFTTDPVVRNKMHEGYAAANQRVVVECVQDVDAPGRFICKLKVPKDTPPGRYDVRAFLQGEDGWSAGHAPLQVRRPPRSDSPK